MRGSSPSDGDRADAPELLLRSTSTRRFEEEKRSMALTLETLEAEVLQLSAAERARLVEKLIASLDMDPAVEEAWAAEVERRHAEIESGAVSLLPGPEALARLKADFR